MGIGTLTCHVFDVTDLEVGLAFWSEVTGLAVIRSGFPGRFAYLGEPDPWRHKVILHLVDTPKTGDEPNRSHVDIWVHSIDDAIAQVEAIGGSLRKEPSLYPRPGSYPGEVPRIDWAVMRDPFGNEFCLVSLLRPEEVDATLAAAEAGHGTDHHWRAAAGRTTRHPLRG